MQRRDDEGVEAAAIAALVPLDGKRVLEVGCGKGRLTALAAARASSVYAFDPSAENVAASRAAMNRALSWCGAQRWSDIEEIESAAADPSLCHPADATTRRE